MREILIVLQSLSIEFPHKHIFRANKNLMCTTVKNALDFIRKLLMLILTFGVLSPEFANFYKIAQRLRPASFALYKALSARINKDSILSPSIIVVKPKETVTSTLFSR